MKHKLAFTLIEILLVVAIIGVIAPTTYVGVSSYFSQARDYHRKKDLKDLEVVMEYYYDAASAYPATIPDCGKPLKYQERVILDSFPCDPTTNQPYTYLTDSLTNYQWYKIYTHLEKTSDLSIPLIGCSGGCGPECAYNFGVASSNISVTACVWSAPYSTPIPTIEPTMTPYITLAPTIQTSAAPTPTVVVPTPAYFRYVCAPGGGQIGSCEIFDDPDRSLCPFVFPNDETCQNTCEDKNNRCKNASGKYKPE